MAKQTSPKVLTFKSGGKITVETKKGALYLTVTPNPESNLPSHEVFLYDSDVLWLRNTIDQAFEDLKSEKQMRLGDKPKLRLVK